MQKKQATGIDTRTMIPVYTSIFFLICLWFLPWISIPALKYSKLPPTYTVFRMDECIANIQQCIAGGGKLKMAPLEPGEVKMLSDVCTGMKIVAVVLTILLAVCVAAVFIKKKESRKFVKICHLCTGCYGVAAFGILTAGNIFINGRMGRENSFVNLTIFSYLQLTSWVYAQIILSVAIFFLAGKLLDTQGEAGPQKYIERSIREDKKMGKRTKVSLFLILLAIPLVIFFGIFFLNDRSSVFIGLCIICLAMLPFAMVFEERKPQAREILLIAVMAAIAVVGRMAFFMLPQFKPVTAIVIIAGIGLGAEAGFLTGAIGGFVSNFFFGQGPWTPWQMFAFGIIGFIAGVVFNRKGSKRNRGKKWERMHLLGVCIYGGIATFVIYGLIMDVASVLNFSKEFTWEALGAVLLSGIPFNMIHGVSTIVFLFFLARPMERKLDRIKKKYGILEV